MDRDTLKEPVTTPEDPLTTDDNGGGPSTPVTGNAVLGLRASWVIGAIGFLASLAAAPAWFALGGDQLGTYASMAIAVLGMVCSAAALAAQRSLLLRVVSVVAFVFATVSLWMGALIFFMGLMNAATASQTAG